MSEAGTVARQGASDAEIRNFENKKADGEQMIHRLRDWAVGDVVFGYDVVTDSSASTGKTFRREEPSAGGTKSGVQRALDALDAQPVSGDSLGEDTHVFAWVARIESVRTEPRDPMDPGEPPLKFAELKDVAVIASRSGAEE